ASQRLCDAEAADARPAPDVATLNRVTRPSVTDDGQHAPALRFGDPRVMALMAATAGFCHLIAGFDNKTLVGRIRARPADSYSTRHATYDLRGLRRKQVTTRTPGSHRSQLPPTGRAVAVLFTKAHSRVLGPGLTALDPRLPADVRSRTPLALAWNNLQ